MVSSGSDSHTFRTDGTLKASPVNKFRIPAVATRAPRLCCIDLALKFQRGSPYKYIYISYCKPADVQPASSRPYSHQEALCILQPLLRRPPLMCALVQDADFQDSRCHVGLGSPCHPCRALYSPLCRRRCYRLGCNVESRLH